MNSTTKSRKAGADTDGKLLTLVLAALRHTNMPPPRFKAGPEFELGAELLPLDR
jgi:hypothetical protein